MTNQAKRPALAAADADEEQRREAARMMGRARSEAKAEAARRNSLLSIGKGGRPTKPLSEIACKCGVGDALEGHKWDCPRGQAIKRRKKAGDL